MVENNATLPILKPIKFRLHMILMITTGTIWEPFYYLICFLNMSKLSNYSHPDDVPSLRNSPIVYFLLVVSILGAPYVYYIKYKLLREYIIAMDSHLEPYPNKVDEEGNKVKQQRPNCIEPLKFFGFALATIILLGVMVSTYTIVIIYLMKYNQDLLPDTLWGNGAFMIFLPIAITATFVTFGFAYRTISEEKKWVVTFNAIASDVTKNKK